MLCDGCRAPVDPLSSERATFKVGDDGPDYRHYHGHCWQTGWYTGIEPKGEWPILVSTGANEPTFDHIKGEGIWTAEGIEQIERDFGVHESDPVNSPSHYRWLPNGIEVIDITETLNFCLGNAVKYILRADHKGKPEEDIRKSIWYLERELDRRKRDNDNKEPVV